MIMVCYNACMSINSESRRDEILSILNAQKKVTVEELQKKLNVSGVTIRTALNDLEKEGYLYRVSGGAIIKEKLEYELPFLKRLEKNIDKKRAIAKEALSLIGEKEAIFLNSGSTVLELAKLLKESKGLTIVTDSFPIIAEFSYTKKSKVIAIGGEINPNHMAFSGPITVRYIQEFFFDKVFLGADGISMENGILANDLDIAEVERAAIKRAKMKIVMADSSKIGLTSGFVPVISSLNEIDCLITDWEINNEHLKQLQSKGIKVKVAAKPKA